MMERSHESLTVLILSELITQGLCARMEGKVALYVYNIYAERCKTVQDGVL